MAEEIRGALVANADACLASHCLKQPAATGPVADLAENRLVKRGRVEKKLPKSVTPVAWSQRAAV